MKRWKLKGYWRSATRILGMLFLFSLFGTALATVGTYAAIHHTAQPEFCNTCHIMEPYYESWLSSSHSNVGCIECHYEPGAVETLHGKFEALSQLAKYVTRTQGTKPWAEVSDASCMRSGCHSVRMLEGEVSFRGVKFDHRQHLLESRRGRRLRCVTCHSQIVQGDHLSVTTSVCFMCHFMPDVHGEVPEATSDCLLCHGPPEQPVEVAGRDFVHADYVARGVDCRECHDPVIEGMGTVRRERCHSCHGEVGHIERIGETEFMHETHVTNHKVECFECHDEIHHGLLELPEPKPAPSEGCGSCHESSHDAALKVYAGVGAAGVEEMPSRMHQTRVLCRACHTGRSGALATGARARELESEGAHGREGLAAHHELGVGTVARAGNVDCIHCHGTGFDGMLGRWQGSVESALAQVQPALASLLDELGEDPRSSAAWPLYDEARRNVELIRLDGSRGAHNPTFALAALRASAERIDRARELVGGAPAEPVTAAFRPPTALGCDECHADVGMSRALPGAAAFPHRLHLVDAALDCDTCHGVGEAHGRTIAREDCASCHHREDDPQVGDCARCHEAETGFLRGALPELPEVEPSVMSEMECTECHGEPPDLMRPSPELCVLCHEEGYDALQREWQAAVGEQLARLGPLSAAIESELPRDGAHPSWAAWHEAQLGIGLVERDGSRGAHNVGGAMQSLRASASKLDAARDLLGLEELPRASAGFPFRSQHGCQQCHAGIGRPAEVTRAEAVFPHRAHLYEAGLDCDVCHSVEEHGEPAFPRDRCADCHHQESPERELPACESCHANQLHMLQGELPGFEPLPGSMAELECSQCHGSPPDLVPEPSPMLCVLCHERGYDELQSTWQTEIEELMTRLSAALESAPPAGGATEARESAQRALQAVQADRSRGVHNYELTRRLLTEALEAFKD